MSEFSESYHLRSERPEDAVELLRRAKWRGYVYQPVNGWVTFLAEGGVFEPDKRIIAAAMHPLLHYVSAEDHGWSFTLYDHGKVVSRYRCDWENTISVDDSEYYAGHCSNLCHQRIQPCWTIGSVVCTRKILMSFSKLSLPNCSRRLLGWSITIGFPSIISLVIFSIHLTTMPILFRYHRFETAPN